MGQRHRRGATSADPLQGGGAAALAFEKWSISPPESICLHAEAIPPDTWMMWADLSAQKYYAVDVVVMITIFFCV